MSEFVDAALRFPAVVFTFMLLVVVAYWVLVMVGGLGIDVLDGEAGAADVLAAIGLGGAPVTVTMSAFIAFGWFAGLTGSVILDQLDISTPAAVALGVVGLALAVVVAWVLTSFVVMLVRRGFSPVRESSHQDFVGRVCTIRTAPLGDGWGQAEVTADDGSSALIHVRQTGQDVFESGSTALIFDYDPDGKFFWVSPFAAELDPGQRGS